MPWRIAAADATADSLANAGAHTTTHDSADSRAQRAPNAIAESHTNASPVEFPNTRADTLTNAAPYPNALTSTHAAPNNGADPRPDLGSSLPTIGKTLNVANTSSDAGAEL
jgi:hypothetical protein